jgi:hypothetical protein
MVVHDPVWGQQQFQWKKTPDPDLPLRKKDKSLFQIICAKWENGNQDWKEREIIE